MDKYQNKYRIPTARLQGYNYVSNGYYVTIRTKICVHYFREIVDGEMQLSENNCWDMMCDEHD